MGNIVDFFWYLWLSVWIFLSSCLPLFIFIVWSGMVYSLVVRVRWYRNHFLYFHKNIIVYLSKYLYLDNFSLDSLVAFVYCLLIVFEVGLYLSLLIPVFYLVFFGCHLYLVSPLSLYYRDKYSFLYSLTEKGNRSFDGLRFIDYLKFYHPGFVFETEGRLVWKKRSLLNKFLFFKDDFRLWIDKIGDFGYYYKPLYRDVADNKKHRGKFLYYASKKHNRLDYIFAWRRPYFLSPRAELEKNMRNFFLENMYFDEYQDLKFFDFKNRVDSLIRMDWIFSRSMRRGNRAFVTKNRKKFVYDYFRVWSGLKDCNDPLYLWKEYYFSRRKYKGRFFERIRFKKKNKFVWNSETTISDYFDDKYKSRELIAVQPWYLSLWQKFWYKLLGVSPQYEHVKSSKFKKSLFDYAEKRRGKPLLDVSGEEVERTRPGEDWQEIKLRGYVADQGGWTDDDNKVKKKVSGRWWRLLVLLGMRPEYGYNGISRDIEESSYLIDDRPTYSERLGYSSRSPRRRRFKRVWFLMPVITEKGSDLRKLWYDRFNIVKEGRLNPLKLMRGEAKIRFTTGSRRKFSFFKAFRLFTYDRLDGFSWFPYHLYFRLTTIPYYYNRVYETLSFQDLINYNRFLFWRYLNGLDCNYRWYKDRGYGRGFRSRLDYKINKGDVEFDEYWWGGYGSSPSTRIVRSRGLFKDRLFDSVDDLFPSFLKGGNRVKTRKWIRPQTLSKFDKVGGLDISILRKYSKLIRVCNFNFNLTKDMYKKGYRKLFELLKFDPFIVDRLNRMYYENMFIPTLESEYARVAASHYREALKRFYDMDPELEEEDVTERAKTPEGRANIAFELGNMSRTLVSQLDPLEARPVFFDIPKFDIYPLGNLMKMGYGNIPRKSDYDAKKNRDLEDLYRNIYYLTAFTRYYDSFWDLKDLQNHYGWFLRFMFGLSPALDDENDETIGVYKGYDSRFLDYSRLMGEDFFDKFNKFSTNDDFLRSLIVNSDILYSSLSHNLRSRFFDVPLSRLVRSTFSVDDEDMDISDYLYFTCLDKLGESYKALKESCYPQALYEPVFDRTYHKGLYRDALNLIYPGLNYRDNVFSLLSGFDNLSENGRLLFDSNDYSKLKVKKVFDLEDNIEFIKRYLSRYGFTSIEKPISPEGYNRVARGKVKMSSREVEKRRTYKQSHVPRTFYDWSLVSRVGEDKKMFSRDSRLYNEYYALSGFNNLLDLGSKVNELLNLRSRMENRELINFLKPLRKSAFLYTTYYEVIRYMLRAWYKISLSELYGYLVSARRPWYLDRGMYQYWDRYQWFRWKKYYYLYYKFFLTDYYSDDNMMIDYLDRYYDLDKLFVSRKKGLSKNWKWYGHDVELFSPPIYDYTKKVKEYTEKFRHLPFYKDYKRFIRAKYLGELDYKYTPMHVNFNRSKDDFREALKFVPWPSYERFGKLKTSRVKVFERPYVYIPSSLDMDEESEIRTNKVIKPLVDLVSNKEYEVLKNTEFRDFSGKPVKLVREFEYPPLPWFLDFNWFKKVYFGKSNKTNFRRVNMMNDRGIRIWHMNYAYDRPVFSWSHWLSMLEESSDSNSVRKSRLRNSRISRLSRKKGLLQYLDFWYGRKYGNEADYRLGLMDGRSVLEFIGFWFYSGFSALRSFFVKIYLSFYFYKRRIVGFVFSNSINRRLYSDVLPYHDYFLSFYQNWRSDFRYLNYDTWYYRYNPELFKSSGWFLRDAGLWTTVARRLHPRSYRGSFVKGRYRGIMGADTYAFSSFFGYPRYNRELAFHPFITDKEREFFGYFPTISRFFWGHYFPNFLEWYLNEPFRRFRWYIHHKELEGWDNLVKGKMAPLSGVLELMTKEDYLMNFAMNRDYHYKPRKMYYMCYPYAWSTGRKRLPKRIRWRKRLFKYSGFYGVIDRFNVDLLKRYLASVYFTDLGINFFVPSVGNSFFFSDGEGFFDNGIQMRLLSEKESFFSLHPVFYFISQYYKYVLRNSVDSDNNDDFRSDSNYRELLKDYCELNCRDNSGFSNSLVSILLKFLDSSNVEDQHSKFVRNQLLNYLYSLGDLNGISANNNNFDLLFLYNNRVFNYVTRLFTYLHFLDVSRCKGGRKPRTKYGKIISPRVYQFCTDYYLLRQFFYLLKYYEDNLFFYDLLGDGNELDYIRFLSFVYYRIKFFELYDKLFGGNFILRFVKNSFFFVVHFFSYFYEYLLSVFDNLIIFVSDWFNLFEIDRKNSFYSNERFFGNCEFFNFNFKVLLLYFFKGIVISCLFICFLILKGFWYIVIIFVFCMFVSKFLKKYNFTTFVGRIYKFVRINFFK